MSLNPCFQVGLDVVGRPCLVIGGGREAEDKTGRLLEAGADLTLVSPDLTSRLQEWAREGRLAHHPRRFQPEDLDNIFLVLNTVAGDRELARQVYDRARAQGCLVNSYDAPAFSDFGMMALVHPGHLRLAISTSNASPVLASRLRQDLEKLFDDEFVDFLDQLARARTHLRAREPDRQKRIARLRSLVADFQLEGRLHYPWKWREKINALLACSGQEQG